MFNVKDPEEMTPEEWIRELAQILAMGYLRLKKHSPYLGDEASDNEAQKDVSSGMSKSFSSENPLS